jgi:cation diffusion facilitator CzcD-associated flavoprotein CzcO
VFEQSERIGGLWPLSTDDGGMVNPDMCTNISRHNVSFSDMAWPDSSSTFPKAWQAGQYLKSYITKYTGIDIQVSSKVLKASRSASTSSSAAKRWKIEVQKTASLQPAQHSTLGSYSAPENTSNRGDAENNAQNKSEEPSVETHYFDYLIVASGFFGKPKLPPASSNSTSFAPPVQHSTQFRDIESLLQNNESATRSEGSKILVVGGSLSGVEVTASIAMQLSSLVHSPRPPRIKDAGKYTVHHVVRRPFWVMPLFLPGAPMLQTDPTLSKVR